MSTLSDLLLQVQKQSPQLAEDLKREIKSLAQRRSFGLNFERHSPESVQLPGRPIRKGDKVCFLAERGESPKSVDQRLWVVTHVEIGADGRVAHLARRDGADADIESTTRFTADLVVVAESRDRIYPGLISTSKVERGGDKPFHAVINAENLHALQALLYTHEGQVDAIYIDPPYNTGAKDWKYNNDYVDGEDAYRHSKWLAFMERRFKLARRLLNRENSVLVVTIDEKEYLRLGLLLQQTFPEADLQMVTDISNRAGSTREGRFSRVDEYVFFAFFGSAGISRTTSNMLSDPVGTAEAGKMPTVWFTAVRRGGGSALRAARPALFYPLLLSESTGEFHSVGDSLPVGASRHDYSAPPGTVAMWPLSTDGREQTWRFAANRMREYFAAGTARLGKQGLVSGFRPVTYLQPGTLQNIEDGVFKVVGKNDEGALELELTDGAMKTVAPGTVWNLTSHYARDYGSNLNSRLLAGRRFPFPKSLYAVEDALRFIVGDKPNALIVDFFSGSGTTAHAVMRLNKQDGGRRRSISVTNNEVSVDEQNSLRSKGLRPGDPEWEQYGICDFITKPRILAAVTGMTHENEPVSGDYKFADEFPMADGFDENVEFFTMTYEAQRSVAHHKSFEAISPLLWLKAGAEGRRIEVPIDTYDVARTYGVLFDLDHTGPFIERLSASETARMAFIVTDDDKGFQMVCADLPPQIDAVRLYSSYLTAFTINVGRE